MKIKIANVPIEFGVEKKKSRFDRSTIFAIVVLVFLLIGGSRRRLAQ